MFRQVWTVALVALTAHGSLTLAAAQESKEAGGKTKNPPKELAVDLGGGVKLEMVLIPAGEFLMGSPDSDKDAQSDEKPQHRVRITEPFYLGKYPVTQEQWEAVMGNNPSYFKGPKNPVELVSWNDCREFVEKLNVKLGSGKYSLPTEAQWEYACRAGSTTRYCFGDEDSVLDEYAWYDKNSGYKTHPVGGKKPNAWGLYDMQGHVEQWCADGGDFKSRVNRGGCWKNPASDCRSSRRQCYGPDSSDNSLGTRVCRVLAEPFADALLSKSPAPLRIQPISPQTVEAGKPLSVSVAVEDARRWRNRLRYNLGANAPPGARIDRQSGEFSWTPPPDQDAGTEDVAVSVVGPDGQRDQKSFRITVTPPGSPEKEVAVDLGGGVKLEMVLIPAGEFLMGSPDSDKNAFGWEKPQHRVRITKPFYVGKYLVTQEQWEAIMGNNPSCFKGPKNPVETVSWEDCQQFLGKLNSKSAAGGGKFRLPSEAQWEYACRAGSTTKYCFGGEESGLGEYAWYYGNSGNTTHSVGGKKPNAWGLYDVHGNVWQWCADWFDSKYYAESPDDPKGCPSGVSRVSRGGSWLYLAEGCRAAFRAYGGAPELRSCGLGFRVARDLAGQ
jgi:formylglycine-generating enzyme required for sulfatase activity